MTTSYCLTHETFTELPWDMQDECIFVTCPPPEVGLTFEEVDQLVPPSEEELIEMDMAAEVLEQDFLIDVESAQTDEPLKKFLNLMDRYYDEQN